MRYLGWFGLCCCLVGSAWAGPTGQKNRRKRVAKASSQLSSQASFTKTTRFRSNRCWRLGRRIRRSIPRQEHVLRRMKAFKCDITAWKRCRASGYRKKGCRDRSVRLLWGKCFRMHRRVFVITHRLGEWKKAGRKAKCRWRVSIPKTFEVVAFVPFPKLSQGR